MADVGAKVDANELLMGAEVGAEAVSTWRCAARCQRQEELVDKVRVHVAQVARGQRPGGGIHRRRALGRCPRLRRQAPCAQ